jgi:hypothetical protein
MVRTVYMLRNNVTGLYYVRGCGSRPVWRPFEQGSMWPSEQGPNGCKHKAMGGRMYPRVKLDVDLEVVPCKLEVADG